MTIFTKHDGFNLPWTLNPLLTDGSPGGGIMVAADPARSHAAMLTASTKRILFTSSSALAGALAGALPVVFFMEGDAGLLSVTTVACGVLCSVLAWRDRYTVTESTPARILARGSWTLLSIAAGVATGLNVGFLGPVLIGVARGHDPIHTGSYGDWSVGLMYTLPILLGPTLGVLAWRGRWRRGLIVIQVLALAFVGLEVWLMTLRD